MRFFYVPEVKKYLFRPALIVFLSSLLLQLIIPFLFLKELTALQLLKRILGFPEVNYSGLAVLVLHLLFACSNAVLAALCGLLYFKIRYRKVGYTLLTTPSLHFVSGLFYIILLYTVLHVEMFNRPLPVFKTPQVLGITKLLPIPTNFFDFFKPFDIAIQPPPYSPPATQPQPQQPGRPIDTRPTSFWPIPPTNMPNAMPSAQQIFSEINKYRAQHGTAQLSWDGYLAGYAQNRAVHIDQLGHLDTDSDLRKLSLGHGNTFYGFQRVGEIGSYGEPDSSDSLINSLYTLYNDVMTDPGWTHMGTGVSGKATSVIFGGEKQ